MKQLVGMAMVLALATPFAADGQDAPAEKKESEKITVRALQIPGGSKNLVLGGTAFLREDTLLKVSVARSIDSYHFGTGEITTRNSVPFPRFTPVKRKQFRVEMPGTNVWGPGLYRVTVETARDGGKTKISKDVACWSESLPRSFADTLKEFDALADEGLMLIEKVDQAATAGPKAFKSAEVQTRVMNALRKKITKSPARPLYRIGIGEISKPISNIIDQMQYFTWDANGNFTGAKSYYGPGEDSQGKPFSFPNEANYIRKAYEIAGREYALWIIREFRRKGELSPIVINGIRKNSEHAGLIDYATMLEELTPENVDEVERRVRKTPKKKNETPAEAAPPAPGGDAPGKPGNNK